MLFQSNTDTNYVGSVSITSTDPQAVVPGSAHTFTTGVSADNGVHQFSVTLETVGTWSITASDGSISGSQSSIAVTPAAASQDVVSGRPTSSPAAVAHAVSCTAT